MDCSDSMKHDGHVCQPCQTEGTEVPAAVWCTNCKEFICTGCINHHRKFAALKHHQLVPIEDMACNDDLTETGHLCQPCQTEGSLVPAAVWCNNCREFICTGFIKQHRKFAALKQHQVVSFKDMDTRKSSKQFTDRCVSHKGKKVKYFCKDHDELGCSRCFVSKHRSCAGVEILTDVVTCETDEFKTLCETISDLNKGFLEQQKKVARNEETISTQNADTIQRIEQAGQNLKRFIDILMEKKKQDAAESMSCDLERMAILSKQLKDVLAQSQRFEEALKQDHANNVQLFFAMKHIQTHVDELRHKLKAAEKQNHVTQYESSVDALLSLVYYTVEDFGTVSKIDGIPVRAYQGTSSDKQWVASLPATYTLTVPFNKDIYIMNVLLYLFSDIETDVALTIQSIEGTKIQCSSHHMIATGELVYVPLKRENGIDGLSMAKNVDYTINVRVSSNTRLPFGYKRFAGNDFQASVVALGVEFTFSKQEPNYFGLIVGLQFIQSLYQR